MAEFCCEGGTRRIFHGANCMWGSGKSRRQASIAFDPNTWEDKVAFNVDQELSLESA